MFKIESCIDTIRFFTIYRHENYLHLLYLMKGLRKNNTHSKEEFPLVIIRNSVYNIVC